MSIEKSTDGLYIVLVSVHGLIRGERMELGRDPDTGGQVKYVVELAKALAEDERVARVDLLTRQVIDKKVDPCYAESIEPIAERANIVRLPCGPRRYLRKETLWPYLDSFVDHTIYHFRMVGRGPDLVHGHYADGGYVGARLARMLAVPFIFTGHSLGRVKKERLLAKGAKVEGLDSRFHFVERFEAEETALDTAVMVVASTRQEVKEQYELYDHYEAERMEVIPPGVDLSRFRPVNESGVPEMSGVIQDVTRFLDEPEKPMILAMARPDERKNFGTLVEAYAGNSALREKANMVLIAGNRDEISGMDAGSRRVLTRLLLNVDKYDLYGKVAYPKHHQAAEVPGLYRLAAARHGVFVNPALTEPFGLTLIEAAASGLPIVATNDGGPQDIVSHCENGILVDPLDAEAIGNVLLEIISNPEQWNTYADKGLQGVHRYYSWSNHVKRYLHQVEQILRRARPGLQLAHQYPSRIPTVDRLVITDIDNTLLGDDDALRAFMERMSHTGPNVGFGIATGRNVESALQILREMDVPTPDVLITSVGTSIRYGKELTPDYSWQRQIDYFWRPHQIREVLQDVPGLFLQENDGDTRFKISYTRDSEKAPPVKEIIRLLRQHRLRAKVFYSLGMFLDIVPVRAGDGMAVRHLCIKWGLPPEQLLVAGDSGNDEEMLSGNTLGVIVGNHSPELEHLQESPRVYFAQGWHAWGVLEGIDHYNFLGDIQLHDDEEEMNNE